MARILFHFDAGIFVAGCGACLTRGKLRFVHSPLWTLRATIKDAFFSEALALRVYRINLLRRTI